MTSKGSQQGGGGSHQPGNLPQIQVSNEKYPGCLVYIGDYTTQLYRDYNTP